jgi:glucose/arabinose dehydrogenase
LLLGGLALARCIETRRPGLGLVAGAVVSSAALAVAVSVSYVSFSLYGVKLIDVFLRAAFSDRPYLLLDAALVVLLLAGWWWRGRRWGWPLALLGTCALAGIALIAGPSLKNQVTPEPVLVAAAIGSLTVLGTPRWRWLPAVPLALSFSVLVALVSWHLPPPGAVPASSAPPVVVPPGFKMGVFAQLAQQPTAMAVDANGDVYVTTIQGSVFRLRDRDGDGVSVETTLFASSLGWPLGIVVHDGRVFISTSNPARIDSGRIVVAEDLGGRAGPMVDILTNLPSGEYDTHQNNGLALGPDGRLYVGVGGTCDHCLETRRFAGSILSLELDGSNVRVFATGLRNPYGLGFSVDGQLFATDNAPDSIDDTLLFIPPDELDLIVEGGHYGFPADYGAAHLAPGAIPPVALFTMRTVPTGLAVYSGDQFPADYRGNVFVALWQRGGLQNATHQRLGQRVARVVLRPSGDGWQATDYDFVTGLVQPIDVKQGIHGELYIADYLSSKIYRVTYASP